MLNNYPSRTDFQIRISPDAIEQITKLYDSKQRGNHRLLCFALKLRGQLHKEVRGIFTHAELSAMLDNENRTLIGERYWGNKRMFLYSLEDGFNLDGLAQKWSVEYDAIKAKVNALSDPAFLYLHESIYQFWNESTAYGSPAPRMDEFLDKFCSDG